MRVLPNNLAILVKQMTRSTVAHRMINNISKSRAAEFTAMLMSIAGRRDSVAGRGDSSSKSLRRSNDWTNSLSKSPRRSVSAAPEPATPPHKLRRMSTLSTQNLLKMANERATAIKTRRASHPNH